MTQQRSWRKSLTPIGAAACPTRILRAGRESTFPWGKFAEFLAIYPQQGLNEHVTMGWERLPEREPSSPFGLMKTYEYAGVPFAEPRSHPWQGSTLDARARYLDFTAAPELIRTSLEDFEPFRSYPAIEAFYALLERINHPKSLLESNDCAFTGPHVSETPEVKAALECSGRVMLLYRDVAINTRTARMSWLATALHHQLHQLDPKFALGMIGTTLVPVRFLALPANAQDGEQLMVSFWAFGDSEANVMQSLARLFKNLSQAIRAVSARSVEAE